MLDVGLGRESHGTGLKREHYDVLIIQESREAEIALARWYTLMDVCSQLDLAVQTQIRWRKEFGGLRVDKATRLRDLER